jgi:hypothetical protein
MNLSKVWLVPLAATGVAFFIYPRLAVVAFEASGADAPRISPPSSPAYRGPAPGLGVNETVVLLHVSDIHVSRFSALRSQNLEQFCTQAVAAVQPQAVLCSGDITDGFRNDFMPPGGLQGEDEWSEYRRILNETGMLRAPQFWFDVRGNHDTYGSGAIWNEGTNLYERFGASSAAARGEPGAYRTWRTDLFAPSGNRVRVVGLDTNAPTGVSVPFNYYGDLDTATRGAALARLREAGADEVILPLLVGHHPDAHINGGLGGALRSRFAYYLSGHLHTTEMRQRVADDMLELEVADLKLKSAFRVLIVDHGQLSLIDTFLGEVPMGVVTNPKDARYLSAHEPAHALASTHLRVAAFTSADANVTSVSVYFDGDEAHAQSGLAQPQGRGLFALPWNASHFGSGRHTVHCTIIDSRGRSKHIKQAFSLDGSAEPLGLAPKQVDQVMGDVLRRIKALLVLAVLTNVVLVVTHRRSLGFVQLVEAPPPRCSQRVWSGVLLAFLLELLFGPWLVGWFVVPTAGGPICFAFAFGIKCAGTDFIAEGLAILFSAGIQGLVVFPALVLYVLEVQGTRADGQLRFGPFDARRALRRWAGLHPRLRWRSQGLNGGCAAICRLLLPLYFILMATALPIVLVTLYLDHIAPIFLSPVMWFIYAQPVLATIMFGSQQLDDEVVPKDLEATALAPESLNDNSVEL